jgi:DNA-binding LytR/AlgR family response regulator
MEGRASQPVSDAARPGRGGGAEAGLGRGGGVEASRAAGAWATALVVDDEVPALDELTYLLRAIPVVSTVHAARSPSEALRSLQERRYDVVFLDVRMPSLNGIELANVLGRFAAPPAIVFVTAYEEYAVRAFDIGACDYLLKPVSRTRLSTALDRALRRSDDRAGEPKDGDSVAIPLETAGRVRWVTPGQVRWVEAEGDYVRLYTADGDAHLVRMPISHLEERWAAHGYIRIHRSYLVPLGQIAEFSVAGNNHSVKVSGQWLPVSRRHARDVRDRLLRAGRRH